MLRAIPPPPSRSRASLPYVSDVNAIVRRAMGIPLVDLRARRAFKILATATALGSSTLPIGIDKKEENKSDEERHRQRLREERQRVRVRKQRKGVEGKEKRKVPQDARAPEGDSRELGFIA